MAAFAGQHNRAVTKSSRGARVLTDVIGEVVHAAARCRFSGGGNRAQMEVYVRPGLVIGGTAPLPPTGGTRHLERYATFVSLPIRTLNV